MSSTEYEYMRRFFCFCFFVFLVGRSLTLNMRGPSNLGLTRSISWQLMPWLLTSPGHQQPWYWLFRICRSSYLRRCLKYLCEINVEEWHKMQIYVYVSSEKFSSYRVKVPRGVYWLNGFCAMGPTQWIQIWSICTKIWFNHILFVIIQA